MRENNLSYLLAGLAIGLVFGTGIGGRIERSCNESYNVKTPKICSVCTADSLSNGYSRLEHVFDTNNIPLLLQTHTPIKTGETQ